MRIASRRRLRIGPSPARVASTSVRELSDLRDWFTSPLPTRNLAAWLHVSDDMVPELAEQIDEFERWVTVDSDRAAAGAN